MPAYKVRDPQTGHTVTLRGDSPPTEAELEQVFAALGGEGSHTPNRTATNDTGDSSSGLAGLGAGLAVKTGSYVPAIIHAGAKMAPSLSGVVGKAGLAGGAFETGRRAMQGDVKGAATTAAGTGAAAALPRVAKAIERATAPVSEAASTILGPSGAPMTRAVPPGALARVAGGLSRAAGPVGLVVDAVTQPGHRAAGETPARTAERQSHFAFQFRDQVNREAGRQVIKGDTVDEVLASIAAYRSRK